MTARPRRLAKPNLADSEAQLRIGARLRAARNARGLTLDQVAEAAGLTKGFVSRLERDDVAPSVASLLNVCRVLGLRVGDLFEQPTSSVVRAGKGQPINFGGIRTQEQLITPGSQKHIEVIRALIEGGGGGGDDLYALNCEVECVYIIRGALEVRFEHGSEILTVGDMMTFEGNAPHTWLNASPTELCEVLWLLVPGQ